MKLYKYSNWLYQQLKDNPERCTDILDHASEFAVNLYNRRKYRPKYLPHLIGTVFKLRGQLQCNNQNQHRALIEKAFEDFLQTLCKPPQTN